MSRTGGEITKARIMATAERLFADKGYAETSMDDIAKTAGVNKALIYYYFTSKDELLQTLLKATIMELENKVKCNQSSVTEQSVREEMKVVGTKKNILTILLRESLRNGKVSDFLFKACEAEAAPYLGRIASTDRNRVMTMEFFTGVIPYMMFLILKDKWCAYFKCTPEQAEKDFARLIMEVHVSACKKLEK